MNEPQSRIYEFGGFRLDAVKRQLITTEKVVVPLMPKAFDTLLYLVRNSGKIVEKDELMREIWTDTVVEENNLNQNISILRKVFGEKRGEHRFIATIPGRGYKFVAEVRQIAEESSPRPETAIQETESGVGEYRRSKAEDRNRPHFRRRRRPDPALSERNVQFP